MPAKKKPDRHFKVGDAVKVNLHTGRIVDATVRAVIENTDGVQLQVDFGHDETALIHAPELRGGAFPEIDPVAEDVEEETEETPKGARPKPQIPYTAPNGVPLSEVSGTITILCHASPDAGWPTLKEFLAKTRKTLTVVLYDFTSEHILQAVEKGLAGNKTLRITLDNPPFNPSHDQSDSDSLKALHEELGDSLQAAWALVRSNKAIQRWIYPSAYHIKVAVRDSEFVWLSSGQLEQFKSARDGSIRRSLINRSTNRPKKRSGLARHYPAQRAGKHLRGLPQS